MAFKSKDKTYAYSTSAMAWIEIIEGLIMKLNSFILYEVLIPKYSQGLRPYIDYQ